MTLSGERATGSGRMDMSERPATCREATPRGPRRIAIIVAMEREIKPLLRLWREERRGFEKKSISIIEGYASEGTWVIVGGIGRKRAAVAAKVIAEYHQPDLIISAGLAGALGRDIAAGAVCRPLAVLDVSSGQKYDCIRDTDVEGVLVTAASVLSRDQKQELAQRFKAEAVDMEAAVVAEVAFAAIKSISDPVEFDMPSIDRFISNGRLDLLKLIAYAALRPRIWPALNELQRNTHIACEALGRELAKMVNGN